MTRLKLTIDDLESTPRRQIVIAQFPFRIGRSLDNDLPLPFGSISSRHLVIDGGGEQITVTDLNSTNGTHHQGQRLGAHQPRAITLPATIRLGELEIDIESADASDVAFTMAQSSTRLRQMVDDAARKSSDDDTHPFFEVLSGPGSGHRFFIVPDGPETVIGTGSEAHICLGLRNLPARLAAVTWKDSHCWLEADVDDVLYQGQALTAEHRLRSGDRFIIGAIELLFFDPLEEALESMNPERAQRPTPISDDSDDSDKNAGDDSEKEEEDNRANATVPVAKRRPATADISPTPSPGRLGAIEIALLAMSVVFFVSTLALLFVFLTA